MQHYEYTIPSPAPGRHYFRIKKIGQNGTSSYSPIVQLAIEAKENLILNFPEVLSGTTEIELSVRQGQYLEIRLYNLEGKMLDQIFQGELEDESQIRIPFNAGRYPSGLYLIKAQSSQGSLTQKVLIR